MEEFGTLVEKCRKNEDSRLIYNASIDHAKVLFRNLLESSKKKKEAIRLITGNFMDSFYNDLAPRFKECLENGSKVEVIVCNERDFSGSEVANLLKHHQNGSVSKICDGKKHCQPHFILVGDKKFRAETNHEQKKAVASFSRPDMGKFLNIIFDQLKPSTTPI